jgi:hypothetical protein
MKKQISFTEQKSANKALKFTSVSRVRAAILALAKEEENKGKVAPLIIKALQASKKDKTIYRFFAENLEANKKGLYSVWNLLSLIRRNAAVISDYLESKETDLAKAYKSELNRKEEAAKRKANKEALKATPEAKSKNVKKAA